MTKEEFYKLKDGEQVWYYPTYFRYAFPAIVKTIDGEKGLWVNFFGDGQCHFTPHFTSFYNAVSTTQQKIQHEHGED